MGDPTKLASLSDKPSPFNRAIVEALESVKGRYAKDSRKLQYITWLQKNTAPVQTQHGDFYVDNQLHLEVCKYLQSNKVPKHLNEELSRVVNRNLEFYIVSGDLLETLLTEVNSLHQKVKTQNNTIHRQRALIKKLESGYSDLKDENREQREQIQLYAKNEPKVVYLDNIEQRSRARFAEDKVLVYANEFANVQAKLEKKTRNLALKDRAGYERRLAAEKQKWMLEYKAELHSGMKVGVQSPGGTNYKMPIDEHLTSPNNTPPGSPVKKATKGKVFPRNPSSRAKTRLSFADAPPKKQQKTPTFKYTAKNLNQKELQDFKFRRSLFGESGDVNSRNRTLEAMSLRTTGNKPGEQKRLDDAIKRAGRSDESNKNVDVNAFLEREVTSRITI